MPDYTFRDATPDDGALVALHRCLLNVETGYSTVESYAPVQRSFAAWASIAIAEGRYVAALACQQDTVVAGAGAYLYDWFPNTSDIYGHYAYLTNVYTDPAHRRQGLARRLVERVITLCRERSISLVRLFATPDGLAMYESMGFKHYPADQPEYKLLLR
jgi:GNAT superfamily N-acetyltransferase